MSTTDGPSVVPDRTAPEPAPRLSLRKRFTALFADPVLRVLALATAVMTLGRGVFLALTVLYFTLIVGLSAVEVAVVLTVASAAGAVCSLLGGALADRLSARRLIVLFELLAGVCLLLYVTATSFIAVLLVAAAFTGANSAAHSVRSAMIARAFTSADRVNARAVLRTVTNAGIAIGSAVAGVALIIGTPEAYRSIMIVAGLATIVSIIPLLRLPARVDAPVRDTDAAASAARGRSPYRDRRYLSLTVLSAIFALHFALIEIGLPLWVLHNTDAPLAIVSVLLVLNTVIVITFQIPLSRGTHDIRKAGRVTAIAGVLMALACLVYAASGAVSAWVAVAFLVSAAIAHTFAEVLSQAGSWGLSFELADTRRAGAYQGVFGLGWSISGMAAPLVITAAVTNGLFGWAALAVMFLLSAGGVWWIAARASLAGKPNSLVG
ncbi:MAG: MFS transporter [Salinibacterium sp.]|nr:MFS transporter [Salinibacterium sp.]MBF0672006.1 MFS transporter [Salinibacterium sp.]